MFSSCLDKETDSDGNDVSFLTVMLVGSLLAESIYVPRSFMAGGKMMLLATTGTSLGTDLYLCFTFTLSTATGYLRLSIYSSSGGLCIVTVM